MKQKFFHLDKNYLLKEAQVISEYDLLVDMIERAAKYYNAIHNPLGLEDDTIRKIKAYTATPPMADFHYFYTKLAAIYRFFHGETQLGFVWDGRTHVEYYQDEWRTFFVQETEKMFGNNSFLKILLELTVFAAEHANNIMLVYRLSTFIREHFQVQVYKKKGIRSIKSA